MHGFPNIWNLRNFSLRHLVEQWFLLLLEFKWQLKGMGFCRTVFCKRGYRFTLGAIVGITVLYSSNAVCDWSGCGVGGCDE